MTKSELIKKIISQRPNLLAKTIENAGKKILEYISSMLTDGYRINIRGFGSFLLHYRAPHVGRNPKSGYKVVLTGKYIPYFKPGKKLRDQVNI
ncbi:integration host factor subunit beta [Candidatus Profftia sp. (ex Adelges kitamiensis)]|uniref:integration host factor subunit beta n=1 Tax=Candidatus Profftia sp. (ex Adelges kitamiensis) TaxID=2864218 RepID=UPI001CE2F8B5|nr:integration host factor subunit beta [Candidatus Profftia sp. (ex Adelges kitamiensis)]